MPAKLDAVSVGQDLFGGGTSSGSESVNHPGSSQAQDVAAFLAVLLTTEVDLTAATFAPTWGGTAMSLLAAPRRWDSNKGMLAVYQLEDPPPGPRTVTLAYSGVPTELLTRNLMLIPSTYQGVESIGAPVDAGGGSTTSNSLTVATGLPAHRGVSWHGVGKGRTFTKNGNNKTKRQNVAMLGGGSLLQQDADGNNGSLTLTATHNLATVNWAAFAVDLAPAKVRGSVTIPLGISLACSGGTYRTAPPGKFWEIPDGAPINELP